MFSRGDMEIIKVALDCLLETQAKNGGEQIDTRELRDRVVHDWVLVSQIEALEYAACILPPTTRDIMNVVAALQTVARDLKGQLKCSKLATW
jgi:hypothetical protein